MKNTEILGTLAGVLQLVGYIIYIYFVFYKNIKPNASSWIMWTYGNLLLTGSYISATENLSQQILPAVCGISCVITCIIFVIGGKFEKLDITEKIVLSIDILIGIFWIYSKNSEWVNILVDGTAIISFVPIIRNTYKNPEEEHFLPWLVWTSAYVLLLIVAIQSHSNNPFLDIFYPASYATYHLLIALFALKQAKKTLYKSQ